MPKNIVGTDGSWWDQGLDGDTLKSSGITVHILTMIFVWGYKILCSVAVKDKAGCAKGRYHLLEGAEGGSPCHDNPRHYSAGLVVDLVQRCSRLAEVQAPRDHC